MPTIVLLSLMLLAGAHAAPASARSLALVHRCGIDWSNANGKCGVACPGGVDSECPSGEKCYAHLAEGPCAGSPTTPTPSTSAPSTPSTSAPSTPAQTTSSLSSCPASWTLNSKDCSNLPWQNSARWNCQQTLPSTATPLCPVGLGGDTCVLSRQGNDRATWCVAPFVVCGGVTCASARPCDVEFQSLGGRFGTTISTCADGPATNQPDPTPAPTAAPTTPAPTAAPTTSAPMPAPTMLVPTNAPTTPAPTTPAPTPGPTSAPTPTPTSGPKPTPAPSEAPSAGVVHGGCKAAGAFLGNAGVDKWCVTNCAAGFCPEFMCAC